MVLFIERLLDARCSANSCSTTIISFNEAQAGIKISRKNRSNLRYADDTTLMAESKGELKSLLMKVKEENDKSGLKFKIDKTKIMISNLNTSW